MRPTRRSLLEFGPRLPSPSWGDARLVRACLRGSEAAWDALIDKYKNLIYSIPLKYHAPQQDAADIFQAVCLDLFSELRNLRKAGSLRSWLISVAIHKSYQWKKKQERWADQTPEEIERAYLQAGKLGARKPSEQELIEKAEQEQIVREAVARLQGRCRQMIELLFFEEPALPYEEVAQRLGVATGSVGFIRGRCLKRLESVLKEMGFS